MFKVKRNLAAVLSLLVSSMAVADEWIPTMDFPLMYSRMQVATIHYGLFQDKEKVTSCNIHMGTDRKTHALIYINDSTTIMETDPVNVNYVEFPDGKYVPVDQQYFGKVVHEDSVGRIIKVWDIDRQKLTEFMRSTLSEASRLNVKFTRWYTPNESDKQLPMQVRYYFAFRGEIFEITDKNIIARINQSRRKEYLAYTRAAEKLSTSETSAFKLWQDFFVNYDKKLKFYKQ